MVRQMEERELDWASLYKEAVEIATKAHEGQTRWDKTIPYITHPLAVAANFEVGPEKMVAVMHDVLEDTDVTEDCIRGAWPDRVVDALLCMTHDPAVSYADYIMKLRNNELARKVKAADIRDNLKDLVGEKHNQRRDKYQLALKLLELP
jgi:(p)ppGpp synthase/HD superfamily hydrolase